MSGARDQSRVYIALLASACALLLVLPFVTTFDDFLTAWAIRLGVAGPLQIVAPAEARMAVTLLNLVGVHAAAAGDQVVVQNGQGQMQPLLISWNCVGWQSLILFGLSLVAGLRGNYSLGARGQVVLIGLMGTVLVNLIRISAVCLLAATAGFVPAVLFHDYGGTLMIIGWLFAFWMMAHRWILFEPELIPQ